MSRVFAGFGAVVACLACGATEGGSRGIREACRELASQSCISESEAECATKLEEARVEAEPDGCVDEFDGWIACVTKGPLTCDAEQQLILPAACRAEQAAYTECTEGDDYVICEAAPSTPTPDRPCRSDCGRYAAECKGSIVVLNAAGEVVVNGPFSCTCSAGPNFGASFAIDSCEKLSDVIAAECD